MTTPITDAGGSTPSDEVVTEAMTKAGWAAFYDSPGGSSLGYNDLPVIYQAMRAAMPAPSVDPVGEVGEMIGWLRNIAKWHLHRQHQAAASRTVDQAATLLQQLADDNADLKQSVIAFCAPWAMTYARDFGMPMNHLHPTHYDILAKCGARMDDFTRAALTPEPFVGEPETRSGGKP